MEGLGPHRIAANPRGRGTERAPVEESPEAGCRDAYQHSKVRTIEPNTNPLGRSGQPGNNPLLNTHTSLLSSPHCPRRHTPAYGLCVGTGCRYMPGCAALRCSTVGTVGGCSLVSRRLFGSEQSLTVRPGESSTVRDGAGNSRRLLPNGAGAVVDCSTRGTGRLARVPSMHRIDPPVRCCR